MGEIKARITKIFQQLKELLILLFVMATASLITRVLPPSSILFKYSDLEIIWVLLFRSNLAYIKAKFGSYPGSWKDAVAFTSLPLVVMVMVMLISSGILGFEPGILFFLIVFMVWFVWFYKYAKLVHTRVDIERVTLLPVDGAFRAQLEVIQGLLHEPVGRESEFLVSIRNFTRNHVFPIRCLGSTVFFLGYLYLAITFRVILYMQNFTGLVSDSIIVTMLVVTVNYLGLKGLGENFRDDGGRKNSYGILDDFVYMGRKKYVISVVGYVMLGTLFILNIPLTFIFGYLKILEPEFLTSLLEPGEPFFFVLFIIVTTVGVQVIMQLLIVKITVKLLRDAIQTRLIKGKSSRTARDNSIIKSAILYLLVATAISLIYFNWFIYTGIVYLVAASAVGIVGHVRKRRRMTVKSVKHLVSLFVVVLISCYLILLMTYGFLPYLLVDINVILVWFGLATLAFLYINFFLVKSTNYFDTQGTLMESAPGICYVYGIHVKSNFKDDETAFRSFTVAYNLAIENKNDTQLLAKIVFQRALIAEKLRLHEIFQAAFPLLKDLGSAGTKWLKKLEKHPISKNIR
jgi:hypothetical protein